MANLAPADISDSAGAQAILDFGRCPGHSRRHARTLALGQASLRRRAYDRAQLMDKPAFLDFVIEVMRRIEGQEVFHVLPRRWVVARTSLDEGLAAPRS
jgi:hypothetical protein